MRLNKATIHPAGASVAFRFDGAPLTGLAGETVAAALSAAGIVAFRRTAGGAPRGLYCGMGACFDCLVTIDGAIGQRACAALLEEGMEISGAPPEALVLRDAPAAADDAEERRCDVLVIGGGPAGLAAAVAAAEGGAATVLLDERASLGGQYMKPLARSHTDTAPDAQFRAGRALSARAERAGVHIERDAIVWGAFAPDEIAALCAGVAVTYRPRQLILATGAFERATPLPGWTLPGVMTTGALQGLARAQRVSPGERVLVAGNGPLNLQLAGELLDGGVRVAAVVEAAPMLSSAEIGHALAMFRAAPRLAADGLHQLARIRRAGVEVLWESEVTALEGEARVRAAHVRTPLGERVIAADVVALNLGFQPDTGLARALGAAHRFVDVGLGHLATETDDEGQTSVPGLFAVGDGAALGGARVALAQGRLAGLAAIRALGIRAPDCRRARRDLRRARDFQAALWSIFAPPRFDPDSLEDATVACRCEEVTVGQLRAEIAGGLVAVAALKKATRAGMGRCQGRFCAATVARLSSAPLEDFAFAAPRVPARPVPAAPLMFAAPEFEAPIIATPPPPRPTLPLSRGEAAPRACDVLVIGGGIVGLATSWYLAREGVDVVLADRDEAGMAASSANAGSLHVQLLGYDFTDATPPDGGPAALTLPLAPRSIALWREIAEAAGDTLGLRTEGGLMLADSAEAMDWLRRKQALEARCGIETHVIGAEELRRLAPEISTAMLGASFCPAEGYGDPLRGTLALRRLALGAGVRLLRGAEASAIARDGAVWRVSTEAGEIRAGSIVNATGPWGGRTSALAGIALPVFGTVQQVIVTEPAPPLMRHLVAYARRHLSLKQQANGSLLVGGGWYGAFDMESGRSRNLRGNIQGNLWVAGQVLPALRGLSIVRAWTGLAPHIDAAPLLGEVPGQPGFFNALAANGYTLGPIVARLVADAIRHGTEIDPRFTLARFQ